MANFLTVADDVPATIAKKYKEGTTMWVRDHIIPKLSYLLRDALPISLDNIDYNSDVLNIGGHKLRIVLMKGRSRQVIIPLQNRVNHKYLKAIAEQMNIISNIVEDHRDHLDYGFWSGLPKALAEIMVIMQGEVGVTEAGRVRSLFHPFFCFDIIEYFRRKPGSELFRPMLVLTLLFEEVLVLPDCVLGNFFPQELTGEDNSVIEIYSDALTKFSADPENTLAHEFFHFIHYISVEEMGGQWLSYNDQFTHSLAVVESLARYFDGATETLGAFPGNPYFGANYLKAYDILEEGSGLRLLEEPAYTRAELSVSEVANINRMHTASGIRFLGDAFRTVFVLSLTDMDKAYDFISTLRRVCITQLRFC